MAADGPIVPHGVTITPHKDIDPLDPKGLNVKILSFDEMQAIGKTLNAIIAATPEETLTLNAHDYDNRPDKSTGAVLPPGIGGYTTYYVRYAN